jgi:hypothetical protein
MLHYYEKNLPDLRDKKSRIEGSKNPQLSFL